MEACLQYRPQRTSALYGAVEIVRKKRLRERYLGDLVWLAAKAQYKQFGMMAYSEYDDLLEGKAGNAETEKEQIGRRIEQMLDMFG